MKTLESRQGLFIVDYLAYSYQESDKLESDKLKAESADNVIRGKRVEFDQSAAENNNKINQL